MIFPYKSWQVFFLKVWFHRNEPFLDRRHLLDHMNVESRVLDQNALHEIWNFFFFGGLEYHRFHWNQMSQMGCAFPLSFSYAPPRLDGCSFSYPMGVSLSRDSVPFVGWRIIPSSHLVLHNPPFISHVHGHVEGFPKEVLKFEMAPRWHGRIRKRHRLQS